MISGSERHSNRSRSISLSLAAPINSASTTASSTGRLRIAAIAACQVAAWAKASRGGAAWRSRCSWIPEVAASTSIKCRKSALRCRENALKNRLLKPDLRATQLQLPDSHTGGSYVALDPRSHRRARRFPRLRRHGLRRCNRPEAEPERRLRLHQRQHLPDRRLHQRQHLRRPQSRNAASEAETSRTASLWDTGT